MSRRLSSLHDDHCSRSAPICSTTSPTTTLRSFDNAPLRSCSTTSLTIATSYSTSNTYNFQHLRLPTTPSTNSHVLCLHARHLAAGFGVKPKLLIASIGRDRQHAREHRLNLLRQLQNQATTNDQHQPRSSVWSGEFLKGWSVDDWSFQLFGKRAAARAAERVLRENCPRELWLISRVFMFIMLTVKTGGTICEQGVYAPHIT